MFMINVVSDMTNSKTCCESFNPSTEMIKLFTMLTKNNADEPADYESEVFNILNLNDFQPTFN